MTTASIGTRLDVRKITARIGAVVSGLSPDLVLDPETVAAVREALNEHKALVFRGVDLDDEGQQRFAAYFGQITAAHPTVPAVDGKPNVLPVDSYDGPVNYWHTDVTFVLNPPQASTLRSIIVPPYGGETLIGEHRRRLPGPARPAARLRRHAVGGAHQRLRLREAAGDPQPEREGPPRALPGHQVRDRSPGRPSASLTGERSLFIGGFAQRIVGLPKAESRRLNRVTVAGDILVGIDGSQSYSIQGDASRYSPVFTPAAAR